MPKRKLCDYCGETPGWYSYDIADYSEIMGLYSSCEGCDPKVLNLTGDVVDTDSYKPKYKPTAELVRSKIRTLGKEKRAIREKIRILEALENQLKTEE